MARAFPVASGAADAQAFTGSGTLVGYTVRESAGTPATASLVLRDGTSTAGSVIATISLAASTSQSAELPAVQFDTGVFVDRLAGSTEVVVYVL